MLPRDLEGGAPMTTVAGILLHWWCCISSVFNTILINTCSWLHHGCCPYWHWTKFFIHAHKSRTMRIILEDISPCRVWQEGTSTMNACFEAQGTRGCKLVLDGLRKVYLAVDMDSVAKWPELEVSWPIPLRDSGPEVEEGSQWIRWTRVIPCNELCHHVC